MDDCTDVIELSRPAKRRPGRRQQLIVSAAAVTVTVTVFAGLLAWNAAVQRRPLPAVDGWAPGGVRPDEDIVLRSKRAGIAAATMEMFAAHYHFIVRVIIDGRPAEIPANMGFQPSVFVTEVHTHSADGIIHVESANPDARYTLDQFLTLWGVSSNTEQLCYIFTGPGRTCTVRIDERVPTPYDIELLASTDTPPSNGAANRPLSTDTYLTSGSVYQLTITSQPVGLAPGAGTGQRP